MKPEQLQELVVEVAADMVELLRTNLAGRIGVEFQARRAAQAVALIALADQILATMPVEVAFEYRQTAKQFNEVMEDMWREEQEQTGEHETEG